MCLKDLLEFFQKIVWLIGFGVTVREISRMEVKKTVEFAKKKNTLFLRIDILLIVAQNPTIHRIF